MYRKQRNDIKPFIKYIKKKRRKAFLELDHIGWFIACSIMAIILIIASYLIQECSSWFSSLLQAISTGIITGLVLYILSNIRTLKSNELDNELIKFRELDVLIKETYNHCPRRMMKYFSRSGQVDFDIELKIAVSCALAASEKIFNLGYSFSKEFEEKLKISVSDFKKTLEEFDESLLESYTEKEIFKLTEDFKNIIYNPFIFISSKLQDIEIQREQIDKYPL